MGRPATSFTSLNGPGCSPSGQADYVLIPSMFVLFVLLLSIYFSDGSDGGGYAGNCKEPAGTAVPSADK